VTGQLAFDLPLRQALGRADFFVSPANAGALAVIDGWRGWPSGRMLLTGPAGSGKTHLAAIWAEGSGAGRVAGGSLAAADIPLLAADAVVVDDADLVVGDPAAEAALFHLWNLCAAQGSALLMTAASLPRDWGLGLPDLISRVQSAPLARLDAPDDALLSAVLVKLFADRQVSVDATLIPYLTSRMSRSLADAQLLADRLDRLALRRARPISRHLAAEVLDSLSATQD
jgi:chromosomal replication initiation ATPase DnaA